MYLILYNRHEKKKIQYMIKSTKRKDAIQWKRKEARAKHHTMINKYHNIIKISTSADIYPLLPYVFFFFSKTIQEGILLGLYAL